MKTLKIVTAALPLLLTPLYASESSMIPENETETPSSHGQQADIFANKDSEEIVEIANCQNKVLPVLKERLVVEVKKKQAIIAKEVDALMKVGVSKDTVLQEYFSPFYQQSRSFDNALEKSVDGRVTIGLETKSFMIYRHGNFGVKKEIAAYNTLKSSSEVHRRYLSGQLDDVLKYIHAQTLPKSVLDKKRDYRDGNGNVANCVDLTVRALTQKAVEVHKDLHGDFMEFVNMLAGDVFDAQDGTPESSSLQS